MKYGKITPEMGIGSLLLWAPFLCERNYIFIVDFVRLYCIVSRPAEWNYCERLISMYVDFN